MNENEFKSLLLLLLDDEDIKNKLIEILGDNTKHSKTFGKKSEENSNLIKEIELKNNKLNELEEIIRNKDLEISQLKINVENNDNRIEKMNKVIENSSGKIKELNEIIEDKQSYIDKLSKEIEEKNIILENLNEDNNILNKEIDIFKSKYRDFEKIYKIYESLSDRTKYEIHGIFNRNNISGILFSGSQYENIDMLWEYMKNKIIEEDIEDLSSLKYIFEYFFEGYNNIHKNKVYEMIDTNIGDVFDEDKHIRIWNSNVSGKISNVVLKGYVNLNIDRIEKKSLVEVEKKDVYKRY